MYEIKWRYYDKNKGVQCAEKVFEKYDLWCKRIEMLDKDIDKGRCIGYIATKVETFTRGAV